MKKSYKLFVLWIVLFMIVIMAPAYLPVFDHMEEAMIMAILLNAANVGIVILMVIMYVTESAYWINGVTFEQAVIAGSDRRKRYIFRHLRIFGIFTAIYLFLTVIFRILHVSMWVDFTIFMVGIIGAALFTVRIKL